MLAPLIIVVPEVVAYVAEFCHTEKGKKTVGKIPENQKLFLIFLCQRDSIPFSTGRAAWAEVHRHIKGCTLNVPDQFDLGKVFLKIHFSQNTLSRHKLVILDKLNMDSSLFHIFLAAGLHKAAPVISINHRPNDTKAFNVSPHRC